MSDLPIAYGTTGASGATTPKRERLETSGVRCDRRSRATDITADRYPARHTSITAAVFGDPAPGRSALDRILAARNGGGAPGGPGD